MREIKFRAWDKVEDCYVYPTEVDCLEPLMSYWVWSEGQDYCLEQYTGLKDANGVDIYEGDVLEWLADDDEDKDKCVVEFSEGMFGGNGDGYWLPLRTLRMEENIVVGNIRENPELLNETK